MNVVDGDELVIHHQIRIRTTVFTAPKGKCYLQLYYILLINYLILLVTVLNTSSIVACTHVEMQTYKLLNTFTFLLQSCCQEKEKVEK